MSKNERAILIIEDYIFDLTEPQKDWDQHWFREVSYQRWAGNELLNRVRRNPQRDPVEIVGDFVTQLSKASMKDHEDKTYRQIFNVAYDLALNILEVMRCLQ